MNINSQLLRDQGSGRLMGAMLRCAVLCCAVLSRLTARPPLRLLVDPSLYIAFCRFSHGNFLVSTFSSHVAIFRIREQTIHVFR